MKFAPLIMIVLAGCTLHPDDDTDPPDITDGGQPTADAHHPTSSDSGTGGSDSGPGTGSDSGPGSDSGSPPDPTPICTVDTDCSSDGTMVCSALQTCDDATTVRDVTITWSYMGYPASMYTCATVGLDTLQFALDSYFGQTFGVVGCPVGSYVIPHVPIRIQYLFTKNPQHHYEQCYYIPDRYWITPDATVKVELDNIDYVDYCGF